MAYILPNGVIQFMQYDGDKNYNHTVLFDSEAEQAEYFRQRVTATLDNQSYSKYTKKSVRVRRSSDSLLRFNYLRFKNTAYSSKWFYAFIDEIEYVSNEVSEVFFTVDIIQTWMFNFDFGECFIEREHTATDEKYEHIIPEPIGSGLTTNNHLIDTWYSEGQGTLRKGIIILYVPNSVVSGGQFVDGIFSGLAVKTWTFLGDAPIPSNLAAEINQWITTNVAVSTNILAMYMVQTSADTSNEDFSVSKTKMLNVNLPETIDGYTPRNKKLFCSQFCTVNMSNNNGGYRTLKPELFEGFNFELTEIYAPVPIYTLTPKHYAGLFAPDIGNILPRSFTGGIYDYALTISEFPCCSWASDSFTSWWAQNKNSYVTSLVTSGLSSTMGAVGGAIQAIAGSPISGGINVASSLVGGLSSITNSIAKLGDLKNTPDTVGGSGTLQNFNGIKNTVGFSIMYTTVVAQNAKIIDDYFTSFGYQINELKVPNYVNPQTRRPLWNYVKTNGCIIHPKTNDGLPASVEGTLSNIFDNGITFWSPSVTIGDYTGDNSPQTQT